MATNTQIGVKVARTPAGKAIHATGGRQPIIVNSGKSLNAYGQAYNPNVKAVPSTTTRNNK